jgi:uncharacterized membrane protein
MRFPMKKDRDSEGTQLALERLLFFSDAVMAIAITLLAIDLRLPEEEHLTSNRDLLMQLVGLLPHIIAFVVSFTVIGIYWLAHHRMFRYIDGFDNTLLVLNLVFLFCVALLPFLTALVGHHGGLPLATALYASGLSAMGFASARLWVHAVNRRLVTPSVTPALASYMKWRGLLAPIVFLGSVPLAFVSPPAAQLSWLLLKPAQHILGRRMRVQI